MIPLLLQQLPIRDYDRTNMLPAWTKNDGPSRMGIVDSSSDISRIIPRIGTTIQSYAAISKATRFEPNSEDHSLPNAGRLHVGYAEEWLSLSDHMPIMAEVRREIVE